VRPSKRGGVEYLFEKAIPIDRAGTIELPKLPAKLIVDEYLKAHHVTEEILV